MVQRTQATDTLFKYCQKDGESSDGNIPAPVILIPARCFHLRAIFGLHDAAFLLVAFPNPYRVRESEVGGKEETQSQFRHIRTGYCHDVRYVAP